MAGYGCGGCDGAEPAAILITPLNGSETLAIGENCMPVTWCGILAGVLGIDAEQLWDAAVAIKAAGVPDEDPATGDIVDGLVPPLDRPDATTGPPAEVTADSPPAGKTRAPAARPARAARARRTD